MRQDIETPEERKMAAWERQLRRWENEITTDSCNRSVAHYWPCLSTGAKDRVPEAEKR